MRLRQLHHSWEWLPGDFELPPDLSGRKELYVWRVHRTADRAFIALKLDDGAGIWDATGKLLQFFEHGEDVEFLVGGKQALSLVRLYKQAARGHWNGLQLVDLTDFSIQSKAEIYTPWSYGQYLVLDSKCEKGVVTWREQTEWGYAAFDVATLTPLPASLAWNTATLSPPAFAPDSSTVVCCHRHRSRWWVDEAGDWYDPSPGGLHKLATLTVHELASNTVTAHDLLVTLTEGWLPDRPEEEEWQAAWGPEFVSSREFRIWLPDGSQEILTLPLPPKVEISRPLLNQRPWPEP